MRFEGPGGSSGLWRLTVALESGSRPLELLCPWGSPGPITQLSTPQLSHLSNSDTGAAAGRPNEL